MKHNSLTRKTSSIIAFFNLIFNNFVILPISLLKNIMTCLVNCTYRVTHFFNVASLTYISPYPSSSKSIWFQNFTLNIWYTPWKFNSWYISLRDKWFEQELYHMLLIGENVFFCRVTNAYFFQYCGCARKAISMKDAQFITSISMFHIKTIKH